MDHLGAPKPCKKQWLLYLVLTSPLRVLSRPRWPRHGPKSHQGSPERAPRGRKIAPRGSKMAPRWPQDGPKTAPSFRVGRVACLICPTKLRAICRRYAAAAAAAAAAGAPPCGLSTAAAAGRYDQRCSLGRTTLGLIASELASAEHQRPTPYRRPPCGRFPRGLVFSMLFTCVKLLRLS